MLTLRGKSSQIDKPFNGRSSNVVGTVQVLYGTVTYDKTNVAIGDIYQVCKIPRGVTVIGGYLISKPLEGEANIPLFDANIGWRINPIGFGNLGVWWIQRGEKRKGGCFENIAHFQLGGMLVTHGPQTFITDTIVTIQIIAIPDNLNNVLAPNITIVVYYLYD